EHDLVLCRGGLFQVTLGDLERRVHLLYAGDFSGKDDVSVRAHDCDLFSGKDCVQPLLQSDDVVGDGHRDGAHQRATLIPEQHVGRAEILAEDVELGRVKYEHVSDIGVADRDALGDGG